MNYNSISNLETQSLNLDIEDLYKDWKDVTKVYLTSVEKSWEIGIEWIDGKCFFGKGWYEFTKETELDVGDTLVFFREDLSRTDNINVCIFKGKEYVIDISQGNNTMKIIFYLLSCLFNMMLVYN